VNVDGCGESRIYTFSVTDECGNIAQSFVTVTGVFDQTPPVIINPADFVLPGCNPAWPTEVLASWTDNCSAGGSLVGVDGEVITDDCSQSRTYFFSVIDDCGNVANAITTITRQVELTYPEITAIVDFQLELCNSPWPPFLTTTWSDNCSIGGIAEALPGEISTQGCFETRSYTFNVTSDCGNSAQAVVMVSRIFDETSPVIGPIVPFTVQCNLLDAIPTPSVTDNCSLIQLSFTDEAFVASCDYTFVRTWLATDACFNSTTVEQTIEVVDATGPVFDNIESVITVACIDDIPLFSPTVYGECSGAIVNYQVQTNAGSGNPEEICVLTTAIGPGADWALWLPTHYTNGISASANFVFDAAGGTFDQFANGTAHLYGTVINDMNSAQSYILDFWLENKRDWNEWSGLGRFYKDDLGLAASAGNMWTTWSYYELVNNFSTATGTGEFAGNILHFQHKPISYVFGFQVGIAANNKNTSYGMSGWFNYNGIIDGEIVNGNGDVNVNGDCITQQNLDCINNTSYINNYLAFDECFNSTIFTQLIIVQDTIAPQFIDFPVDIAISCEEWPVSLPNVVAIDNCGGDVNVELFTQTSESNCEDTYLVSYLWTATDICGNTSQTEWNVTVIDSTPPIITNCPNGANYVCPSDIPLANVLLVSATDNCSNITVVHFGDIINGNDCSGLVSRTYRAYDQCGNYSDCVQLISYQDTIAPIFDNIPANVFASCENIPPISNVTASDNCGSVEVTITVQENLFSGACLGVIQRVYTASDACGNTATFDHYITLVDSLAPVFANLPADAVYQCNEVIPAPFEVTAVDNCDPNVLIEFSLVIIEGECPNEYIILRTWNATDICENTISYTQVISVHDDIAPTFNIENSVIYAACDVEFEISNPIALDSCDDNPIITVTSSNSPGECANVWIEDYVWTATDNCGNSSSVSITVEYIDEIAPVFTLIPNVISVECGSEIPITIAEASDNCGDVAVTYADSDLIADNCGGYYLRTFSATDACGNVSQINQIINIIDTTSPVFSQSLANVMVECSTDAPAYVIVSATDNCGIVDVQMTSTILSSDNCGNYVEMVLYTAGDDCGNSATQFYTITVLDVTPPLFIDAPVSIVLDCLDSLPIAPVITALDNCDSLLSVIYTEQFVGNVPAYGSISNCSLNTAPNTNPSWSILLLGLPAGYTSYDTENVNFVEFPDGTAHLTGTVVSTLYPNAGWIINVWFMNGLSWSDWSNQSFSTGYKNDEGLAGNNYLDWTYYITNGSAATLTGTGDLVGSFFNLSHLPTNLHYGFQVGIAANNLSAGYGMGGWFHYEGNFQNTNIPFYVNGTNVSGAGDFAFEGDCCPDYTLARSWTATDCSGNTTTWTQNVSFTDLSNSPELQEVLDSASVNFNGIITISSIYPNPSNGATAVEFISKVDTQIHLDVYDAIGNNVAKLFAGNIKGGILNKVILDVTGMPSGMYFVRLSSENEITTKKFVIQQ